MKHLLRTVLRKYFRGRMTLAFAVIALLAGIVLGLAAFPRKINGLQVFYYERFVYIMALPMLLSVAGGVLTASGVCADGAVRNQCIAGYTKSQIFCAQVIGAGLWGMVLGLLTVLPCYFIGQAFFLRLLEGQTLKLLVPLILGFPMCAVFASAIAMAVQQRALSVVFCMGMSLLLYFGGFYFMQRLDEPKYHAGYYWDNETGEEREYYDRNFNYIKPPARNIIEFLNLANPVAALTETGWYLNEIIMEEDASLYGWDYRADLSEHDKEVSRKHAARRRTIIWFQVTLMLAVSAAGTWSYQWRDLK